MSISSVVGRAYRATELDIIRPSSLISASEAETLTERNNLGNTAMYAANAVIPFSGVFTAIVAAGKVGYGMVVAMSSLGTKGEPQEARMKLAADWMKSGAENLLVGTVSLFPGAGSYFAGAMAVRSLADTIVAKQNLLALPAPKAN